MATKKEDEGKRKKVVGLRYIGKGSYLPYVPARNLTLDDMKKHKELLDDAKKSGAFGRLYEPVYGDDEEAAELTAEEKANNG